MEPDVPDELAFDEDGLIPTVVQDAGTGEVRMVAWVNREALQQTLETGYAHFYSRSRESLWKKGETSGHVQRVRAVRADCDRDTLLYLVDQEGVACHTGSRNCFFYVPDGEDGWKELDDPLPDVIPGAVLAELEAVVADRDETRPEDSYTASLLEAGEDRVLEKLGEECSELLIAAKNDDTDSLLAEAGDLVYHLLVLLREKDVSLRALTDLLNERRR